MLKFEKNERRLNIVFNEKCVYTLDSFKPAPFTVGKGENTYSMSHGSFKIKEGYFLHRKKCARYNLSR